MSINKAMWRQIRVDPIGQNTVFLPFISWMDHRTGKRGARYRKIDMGEVQEFDFSLSEFTDNKTGDDD